MPQSIPYDPSLTLGNIVDQKRLDALIAISDLQGPIDAAEDAMNLAIQLRRSLDLTITEMVNLGVDTTELIKTKEDADKQVQDTAIDYAKQRSELLPKIAEAKKSFGGIISKHYESPIDYNKSQIKKMPLSSDSLRMNAQYFSFQENKQNSQQTIIQAKGFVTAATSFLGTKRSAEVTTAVGNQMSEQIETNNIEGTLLITVTCTHKDAALLAPFVIDVDKAIRVWNQATPDKNKRIKVDDVQNFMEIAKEEGTEGEAKLNLLSGVTYGSSFVGMVHILKSTSTQTSEKVTTAAASLQGQMSTGNWFAAASGGFGVESSFANDVKSLLSNQKLNSTCSIITMGSIPVIKSNEVQMGVKQFADFDPAKMMGQLAVASTTTNSEQASVAERAQAARTGGQMLAINASKVEAVIAGLGPLDERKNKVLDTNSLMTAFEDYVDKCLAGNLGVPINFYLKSITRAQLAQMWVAKYYPNQYLMIEGDDSNAEV